MRQAGLYEQIILDKLLTNSLVGPNLDSRWTAIKSGMMEFTEHDVPPRHSDRYECLK